MNIIKNFLKIFGNMSWLIISIIVIAVLLSILNPTVVLQGLSTGMGVIFANEFYKMIKEHSKRFKDNIFNIKE